MIGHHFSDDANDMLKERNIRDARVRLALEDPERHKR
jgi:hypothetical protein